MVGRAQTSSQNDAAALRYRGHIPGLDVLRGVAILMVLLYHGFDARVPWQTVHGPARWLLGLSQYGASGVQLFFVLSGFLITGILLDTVSDRDYYRKFYTRRALRIFPAYLLMLAVLWLTHTIEWRFVVAAVLYIANMAGLVGARSAEYGSLWSLAVEEQFYLLWPFFVRRLSMQALARFSIGYLLFSTLLRVVWIVYLPSLDTTFKLWFNADLLLSGALVAMTLRQGRLSVRNVGSVITTLASVATCVWLLIAVIAVTQSGAMWARSIEVLHRYLFIFAYMALLLAVLRASRGPANARQGSWPLRALRFFGYISYGLYLVHQFVIDRFDRLVHGTVLDFAGVHWWSLPLNTLLALSLATGIAFLSRRYFEEPFLRRKNKAAPYLQTDAQPTPASGVA